MASQATQTCETMEPCVRRSWYARFMHTVEWNDLREVPPRFVTWRFLPHHWSLAVLRQGKKPEKKASLNDKHKSRKPGYEAKRG